MALPPPPGPTAPRSPAQRPDAELEQLAEAAVDSRKPRPVPAQKVAHAAKAERPKRATAEEATKPAHTVSATRGFKTPEAVGMRNLKGLGFGNDVLAFQRWYAALGDDDVVVPETGKLDAATISASIRAVKKFQAMLKKLDLPLGNTGANHDGVDGDFHTKSRAAVEYFQLVTGCSQKKGVLDDATRTHLVTFLAQGSKLFTPGQAVVKRSDF